MQRTLVFDSLWDNEWEFDSNESSVAPGARALAEEITSRLKKRVLTVSGIAQHSYYGWAFSTQFENCSFYHVSNPVDEVYLTIGLRGYLFKALLLRRPRATFERYCDLLRDTLELVRDISGFRWQE